MSRIAIVDDQLTSLKILERLAASVEGVSTVATHTDPRRALAEAEAEPPDLILVDYRMPDMDGADFIGRLRRLPGCADLPVVVVTVAREREVRYRALQAGATDFLTKPVDHIEFKARTHNLLILAEQRKLLKDRTRSLEQRVRQATQDIRTREYETLLRLAKAGEYRDEETGNHVMRMAKYSRLIAEHLGLPEERCQVIEVAAPMHDIGKIGIPDRILLKPGRLTAQEFEIMKAHTRIGYEILKGSPSKYLQMGAQIALGHHERYDGSGYPFGLAGKAIPLPARIVAVADVFDALTTARPYKQPWAMADALAVLNAQRGRHFDPACVDAFIEARDRIMAIRQCCQDTRHFDGHL